MEHYNSDLAAMFLFGGGFGMILMRIIDKINEDLKNYKNKQLTESKKNKNKGFEQFDPGFYSDAYFNDVIEKSGDNEHVM